MKRGFTLIELLVVIAIMTIILTPILISYQSYVKQKNLDLTAREIQSALYEALSLSHAPSFSTDAEKIYGYGVYFNKGENKYVVFKGRKLNSFVYTAASDEILKSYRPRSGVTITDFNPSDPTSLNTASVVFALPELSEPSKKTYFNGLDSGQIPSGEGIITLKADVKTRNITINLMSNLIEVSE